MPDVGGQGERGVRGGEEGGAPGGAHLGTGCTGYKMFRHVETLFIQGVFLLNSQLASLVQ